MSTFSAKDESLLVRARSTLGARKNESHFVKVVIEDITAIKAKGGKVSCINTDGAMADWHPALKAALKEAFPAEGMLVLTCAAHGASLFFKDAFGVGRAAYSLSQGNGLWVAHVLEESIGVVKFIMRHEVVRSLFLANPVSLALRQPQEQRMGGGFLVLERLLKDKKAIFELFEHPALKLYVTDDVYGKKYKAAYDELYGKIIDMPDANAWWKALYKAVVALEPAYMLLRLCDKCSPNLAKIAMAFERVERHLRELPELYEVGDNVKHTFTVAEKQALLDLFLDRKAYVLTPLHRGAAFFDPANFLTPHVTEVPVTWTADLKTLLRELYPGDDAAEKRAFIVQHLERMHNHDAPFDNPGCWVADSIRDIGSWWARNCHLGVESSLDLAPLREAGILIGNCQASAGETERINKVASRVKTKYRTQLTAKNTELLAQLCHFFQQKNARAERLRALLIPPPHQIHPPPGRCT